MYISSTNPIKHHRIVLLMWVYNIVRQDKLDRKWIISYHMLLINMQESMSTRLWKSPWVCTIVVWQVVMGFSGVRNWLTIAWLMNQVLWMTKIMINSANEPRKSKGGIYCAGYIAVTYGGELLYLRPGIFFVA